MLISNICNNLFQIIYLVSLWSTGIPLVLAIPKPLKQSLNIIHCLSILQMSAKFLRQLPLVLSNEWIGSKAIKMKKKEECKSVKKSRLEKQKAFCSCFQTFLKKSWKLDQNKFFEGKYVLGTIQIIRHTFCHFSDPPISLCGILLLKITVFKAISLWFLKLIRMNVSFKALSCYQARLFNSKKHWNQGFKSQKSTHTHTTKILRIIWMAL